MVGADIKKRSHDIIQLTLTEIAALAHVSEHDLRGWVHSGYLERAEDRPGIDEDKKYRWSELHALQFLLMAELTRGEAKIKPRFAGPLVQSIIKPSSFDRGRFNGSAWLVFGTGTFGLRWKLVKTRQKAATVKFDDGGARLFVDIGRMSAELDFAVRVRGGAPYVEEIAGLLRLHADMLTRRPLETLYRQGRENIARDLLRAAEVLAPRSSQ